MNPTVTFLKPQLLITALPTGMMVSVTATPKPAPAPKRSVRN